MTPEERNELQDKLAGAVVECMDLDTLIEYACDRLSEHYSTLSDDELMTEVEEFAPFLIEEE